MSFLLALVEEKNMSKKVLYVDATTQEYNRKKISIVYVLLSNGELIYRERLTNGIESVEAELYAIKSALSLYPDETKIILSDCDVAVNLLNTNKMNYLVKIESGDGGLYGLAREVRVMYEESDSVVEWVSRNKNVAGKYIEKINKLRRKFRA